MAKQRRSFSAEFKREASDLVLKQNYSYIEASRLLCAVGLIRFRRSEGVTSQSNRLHRNSRKSRSWKLGSPALNEKNRY